MGYKIGICGLGPYGKNFLPVFQAHPSVEAVYAADVMTEALDEVTQRFGVQRTFPSLEALLESDCDAIAVCTQRWLHAPQVLQVLRAGKHVYSAVPAAVTLDELSQLVSAVEETRLTYMLGETSYYRPQTIYCRQRFAAGDFGKYVYGEGQYHHDMSHFYTPYSRANGPEWKRVASFPPMLYPTHSVSHVLSVTFRRMTAVSCFGFEDMHEDGIFRREVSQWGNPYSNETGLFRTSDGGMARINEFRRTGAGESRMSIIGTTGAYEEQTDTGVWTWLEAEGDIHKDGQINYQETSRLVKRKSQDVSDVRATNGVLITEENLGQLPRNLLGQTWPGVSYVHDIGCLPVEFFSMKSGHGGSHQFLVADFLDALNTRKLPPNNVWLSARYNAPGIVAHESAMRGGELLEIPDFGSPPADWEWLDPATALQP
ncbi:MAG TPA: Gfo/Idh/MocA family oxidoreductase [Chloroflexota bacterium]|nr:Gfo/Idh/MocA family oxidoreductase [Chloroflexota bacterium]